MPFDFFRNDYNEKKMKELEDCASKYNQNAGGKEVFVGYLSDYNMEGLCDGKINVRVYITSFKDGKLIDLSRTFETKKRANNYFDRVIELIAGDNEIGPGAPVVVELANNKVVNLFGADEFEKDRKSVV